MRRNRRRNLVISQLEQSYNLLVQNIQDYAVFTLDNHGLVSGWGKGARKQFGYRPPEILGSPYSAFFTKEDVRRGVPKHNLKEAMRGGAIS